MATWRGRTERQRRDTGKLVGSLEGPRHSCLRRHYEAVPPAETVCYRGGLMLTQREFGEEPPAWTCVARFEGIIGGMTRVQVKGFFKSISINTTDERYGFF